MKVTGDLHIRIKPSHTPHSVIIFCFLTRPASADLIMARSPPRFRQVLRASLQFRVGMLMMRKHDFSRRTQPSGQAGPVTERDQIKMELSLRIRSLILSKADREIESPFYFNSELTQFTFIFRFRSIFPRPQLLMLNVWPAS